MGAALTGAALWLQPRRAVALVAVMTAVLWCGWGLAIAPQLDGESSSRDLMREARDLAGPGTEVGLVAWREQNLLQARGPTRSEEHTSELQSLMRSSYAVFCLKKKDRT